MQLIVLLGQTCSGKSQLAIDLAKALGHSWVVNCDSRQVYARLNIGTAKVPGVWRSAGKLGSIFQYQEIPHFLIDFVPPQRRYSLADYVQDWINLFAQPGAELPKYVILTGGTGLFAKAALEEYQLTSLKPEFELPAGILRNKLEALTVGQLQDLVGEEVLQTLNASDRQNHRRLLNRAFQKECASRDWLGCRVLEYPKFSQVWPLVIQIDSETLAGRIQARLSERLDRGLVEEVESLQDLGTSRLLELGLEYRLTQLYLLGQLSQAEWLDKLYRENLKYAKRQLTWLKKQPLKWVGSLQMTLDLVDKPSGAF